MAAEAMGASQDSVEMIARQQSPARRSDFYSIAATATRSVLAAPVPGSPKGEAVNLAFEAAKAPGGLWMGSVREPVQGRDRVSSLWREHQERLYGPLSHLLRHAPGENERTGSNGATAVGDRLTRAVSWHRRRRHTARVRGQLGLG